MISRSQSRTCRFIVLVTFDLYPYRLLTFPEIRARAYVAAVRARTFAPFPRISVHFPSKVQQTYAARTALARYIHVPVIFQSLYRILPLVCGFRNMQARRRASGFTRYSRRRYERRNRATGPDDVDSVLIGNSVYTRCPLIKLIN